MSLQTYVGNCHCGRFKFKVTVPEIKEVYDCNCTFCVKAGPLWAGVRGEGSEFAFERGTEDDMKTYRFGSGKGQTKFCPTCGTSIVFREPTDLSKVSVNARTIRDLDVWSLNKKIYPGVGDNPTPDPPRLTDLTALEPLTPDEKIYNGSCHCGAVVFALKSLPLVNPAVAVKECNCSHCLRRGLLSIYPQRSHVLVQGEMREYSYGKKFISQRFCGVCGVQVVMDVLGPGEEVVRKMGERGRRMVEENKALRPVNLRCLNDLSADEWKGVTGRVEREDGWKVEPAYVVD